MVFPMILIISHDFSSVLKRFRSRDFASVRSQAALCDIEARRLLAAENAQLSAELRLEAAAQRCSERSAAAAAARRRGDEALKELRRWGEEEEKSVESRLRLAERALEGSLRWCEKQNRLTMSLFVAPAC